MHDTVIYSVGMTLDRLEKLAILSAFKFYRNNKTATANSLGISIRTLDNKLSRYSAEEQREKDLLEQDKIKREEHLLRARGVVPDNIYVPGASRVSDVQMK